MVKQQGTYSQLLGQVLRQLLGKDGGRGLATYRFECVDKCGNNQSQIGKGNRFIDV